MEDFIKIVDKWIKKIKQNYVFFGDDRVVLEFKDIAHNAYNGSIPSYEKLRDLIAQKYGVDSEVLNDWISFYKDCIDEVASEQTII